MSDQDVKAISSATGTFRVLPGRSDPAPAIGKTPPVSGNEVPDVAPTQPDLEALAAQLNVANQSIGRDLRFKVDMAEGQSVIQVLDRETGEIIREIPPEKARLSVSASGSFEIRLYDGVV
ncbi:MAG: flagellar protein FlaG [Woeseiaceae bacterium]|nr:flagellar protein FlaG [Woeseiaceae bacterium]